VRFQESTISDLFAGQAGPLIASDVILADDGSLRIVLPDAPISPPREPVPADTVSGSNGPDVQALSPVRIGESTTAFPSAIPADQHGRGRKTGIDRRKRSFYRRVHQIKDGRWEARVRFNKQPIWLGRYASEHEAAYASNVAERTLYAEEARVNNIPMQNEPGPESVAHITARVDHALRKSGLSGNPLDLNLRFRRWSRERGVSWHRASSRWQARLRHQDRLLCLGYYTTRFEAELAHNHAALLLRGENSLLNVVSPEDLPSEVDEPAIQAKVAKKLRRYGYG
jgi:hypothetical protein